jgi:hypothetical protein
VTCQSHCGTLASKLQPTSSSRYSRTQGAQLVSPCAVLLRTLMSYTHKSIPWAPADGAGETLAVAGAKTLADDAADARPFATLDSAARDWTGGLLLGGIGVSLVIYFGTMTCVRRSVASAANAFPHSFQYSKVTCTWSKAMLPTPPMQTAPTIS